MKLKKVIELPQRWPFSPKTSLFHRFQQVSFVAFVGTLSKFWLRVLTTTRTKNLETLSDLVLKRRFEDRPLLTVTNHTSCIDDPTLFGLLPFRLITKPGLVRWTPGADEIMFYNDRNARILGALGRTVPTIRGLGVYQKSIDFCLEKLDQGGWVHMFSEGKVNMDHRLLRLKWGAARMMQEAKCLPIVLPFWHMGMDELLPNTRPYIPQIGKKITLVVGSPIDLTEQIKQWQDENFNKVEIRKRMMDVIQKELRLLKTQCETMHATS